MGDLAPTMKQVFNQCLGVLATGQLVNQCLRRVATKQWVNQPTFWMSLKIEKVKARSKASVRMAVPL